MKNFITRGVDFIFKSPNSKSEGIRLTKDINKASPFERSIRKRLGDKVAQEKFNKIYRAYQGMVRL